MSCDIVSYRHVSSETLVTDGAIMADASRMTGDNQRASELNISTHIFKINGLSSLYDVSMAFDDSQYRFNALFSNAGIDQI